MAFLNPSDSAEVLYGASGDVRDELNVHISPSTAGHYIDENEIPGSLIIRSLRNATRLVNGYLEVVYADQIPFSAAGDVPKLLDTIATDIATYFVLRSGVANVAPLSDTKKRDYYDDYVKPPDGILVKLSDRKIQLPELTANYASDSKMSQKKERHPIFDVDDIANQEVDPDLVDDIQDDRNL